MCVDSWARTFENASENRILPPVEGSGRSIGIELECNPTFDSAVNIWASKMVHFKHDGSLRGSNPTELVSPILYESCINDWVARFCKMLDISEYYSRQSTHIHIGTGDLSPLEINAICTKAYVWEKFFTALCPPNRAPLNQERNDGGPHTLPKIPFFNKKADFIRLLYGTNNLRSVGNPGLSKMQKSKRCNDGNERAGYPHAAIHRYDWLNIHGHFHKKAIEWRIFASTQSEEKLIRWIRLLLQITEFAKRYGAHRFHKTPISHMVSSDTWYWVLHRIASLRELHIKKGSLSGGDYTDNKEVPIKLNPEPKADKYAALFAKKRQLWKDVMGQINNPFPEELHPVYIPAAEFIEEQFTEEQKALLLLEARSGDDLIHGAGEVEYWNDRISIAAQRMIHRSRVGIDVVDGVI